GEGISATLQHRDPSRGMALYKLSQLPKGVPALPLAAKPLRKGDSAHGIGNPAVAQSLFSYLPGTVREVYHRKLPVIDVDKLTIAYELDSIIVEADLALNRGDSGGPIVNEAGELAGINFGMQLYARGFSAVTIDAVGDGARLVSVSSDVTE